MNERMSELEKQQKEVSEKCFIVEPVLEDTPEIRTLLY